MTAKKSKKPGSRRRKEKPTADETVETQTGGIQLKLADPEKLEHHLANVKGYEKRADDAKAVLKKQYEAAQADGISKQLLKELMALQAGDPIAARKRLEDLGVGLKVIGASFQLNVFDTMYGSEIEQAKAEGRIAGAAGKAPECRFTEGSQAHQAFLEEYHVAQAARAPGAEKLSEGEIRGAIKKGQSEGAAAFN